MNDVATETEQENTIDISSIDLNDPDALKDLDADTLANIALQSNAPENALLDDESVDINTEEFHGRQTEDNTDDAESDTESDEKEGEGTVDVAAQSETEDDQSKESGDDGTTEDQQEVEAKGVETANGEAIIPFSVLKETRAAKTAAQQRNQELERQIEQLKNDMAVERAKHADNNDVEYEIPDDVKNMIAERKGKFVEEYGESEAVDALFGALEDNMLVLGRENATLAKKIEAQQDILKSQDEASTKSIQEEIDNAIDNVPELVQWTSREDSTWRERLANTYDQLMKDADYASKPLQERFNELPAKVQALYGEDPGLEVVDKQDADTNASTNASDKKTVGSEEPKATKDSTTPHSLDSIPGGSSPEGSKYGPVGGMSGAAMTSHLEQMSDTEREALLNGLA